jgi:hypothetical protein
MCPCVEGVGGRRDCLHSSIEKGELFFLFFSLHCRTNITTEGTTTFTTSRGHLVSSFLLSHPSHDPLATIDTPDAKYAGFNLLLLSPSPSTDQTESLSYDGFFITNAGPGGPITSRPLTPDERRCGSISNGVCAPGAPACDWPKVKHGIDTLHRILFDTIVAPTVTTRNGTPESVEEAEGRLVEDLFDLLTSVLFLLSFLFSRDDFCSMHMGSVRTCPFALFLFS